MAAVVEARKGDEDDSDFGEEVADNSKSNIGRRIRRKLKEVVTIIKKGYDDAFQALPLPPKYRRWLKIIVSKLLKMGISYLQGSYAYRGVRRAALQRDQTFPKFPLI